MHSQSNIQCFSHHNYCIVSGNDGKIPFHKNPMISMILQLVQQSNVSESLFSELMMYCAYSVRPQMYFLSDYTKLCSQIHVWSHGKQNDITKLKL